MTQALQSGAVFGGRYEVLRCIGSGGMGAVYEVLHRDTRRRRALKVLLPVLVSDPDARARFAQEATITADIVSENLVDVFDAGVDEQSGCPFIVLELLRGQSLGDALASGRRFSPDQAVDVLRQIARALDKTHASGIVHRDLKPDNLFAVEKEDGTTCVKILDFGIAKMIEQVGKSRNTVNIGTPLYMAPEQMHGARLDGRADLYSLGHIAYELLTGESYWEHEVRTLPSTIALVAAIQRGCPVPASVRAQPLGVTLGPAFDAWFARAVAPEPTQRFPSAGAMVDALALVFGLPPDARPSLGGGRPSLASIPGPIASQRAIPAHSIADPPSHDRTTQPLSGRHHLAFDAGPASEPLSGVSRHRWTGRGGASPTRQGLILGAVLGGGALLVGAIVLAFVVPGRSTSGSPSASAVAAPSPSAVATSTAGAESPIVVASSSASASASAAKSAAPIKVTPTSSGRRSTQDSLCRREPSRCR